MCIRDRWNDTYGHGAGDVVLQTVVKAIRQSTRKTDSLVPVSYTHLAKLMKELNFKPQKTGLIVNRVPDGKLDAGTLEEIRNQGLELLGVVPHDDQVYQYDCDGKPIIRLPKDSPVRSALGEIVKKLGL